MVDNAARSSRAQAGSPPGTQGGGEGKPSARGQNVAELTVTELSNGIKRTWEGTFGYVRLRGEISG